MPAVPQIVVMGVAGAGKSTVGEAIARRLGVTFLDGDDLHPPANADKMRAGIPLDDLDRVPWLLRIGERLAEEQDAGRSMVIACSALKRWYRELLRSRVPDLVFVHLHGDASVIAARMSTRTEHFMPTSLLASQLATLQPLAAWEHGASFDVEEPVERIVDGVVRLVAPVRDPLTQNRPLPAGPPAPCRTGRCSGRMRRERAVLRNRPANG